MKTCWTKTEPQKPKNTGKCLLLITHIFQGNIWSTILFDVQDSLKSVCSVIRKPIHWKRKIFSLFFFFICFVLWTFCLNWSHHRCLMWFLFCGFVSFVNRNRSIFNSIPLNFFRSIFFFCWPEIYGQSWKLWKCAEMRSFQLNYLAFHVGISLFFCYLNNLNATSSDAPLSLVSAAWQPRYLWSVNNYGWPDAVHFSFHFRSLKINRYIHQIFFP